MIQKFQSIPEEKEQGWKYSTPRYTYIPNNPVSMIKEGKDCGTFSFVLLLSNLAFTTLPKAHQFLSLPQSLLLCTMYYCIFVSQ